MIHDVEAWSLVLYKRLGKWKIKYVSILPFLWFHNDDARNFEDLYLSRRKMESMTCVRTYHSQVFCVNS